MVFVTWHSYFSLILAHSLLQKSGSDSEGTNLIDLAPYYSSNGQGLMDLWPGQGMSLLPTQFSQWPLIHADKNHYNSFPKHLNYNGMSGVAGTKSDMFQASLSVTWVPTQFLGSHSHFLGNKRTIS